MQPIPVSKRTGAILRDLGDGLILRRATRRDAPALVQFHRRAFANPDTGREDELVGEWVQELTRGHHPTFAPEDFTLVEDTQTGRIVSSLCLISQMWTYDGIEFGVGRPEVVATYPEYRKRGLIRAQFDVIHQWSAERGELVQAITGIPNFYRRLGYEYALSLWGGHMVYNPQGIPPLKKGERESYRLRPVSERDLPLIAKLYEQANRRYLVWCVRNPKLWRYELQGRSRTSPRYLVFKLIERQDGRVVGALVHFNRVQAKRFGILFYELLPGVSWLDVTPSVLRLLQGVGKKIAARTGDQLDGIGLWLGHEHPVFEVLSEGQSRIFRPYAWYLRVPDLPAFVRRIAPALERRLAESPAAGHSGTLKLNFFVGGLALTLDKGHVAGVEPWQAAHTDFGQSEFGSASFPNQSFIQLLFGYRSLAELQHTYPDCTVDSDATRVLLNALFPKRFSHVWPIQ